MRSEDISAWTPSLDWISVLCSRKKIFTVGIGDGGNEVGMGNFVTEICNIRPDFRKCISVIRTDVTIPVDVSNWGCYALSTALSYIWREMARVHAGMMSVPCLKPLLRKKQWMA